MSDEHQHGPDREDDESSSGRVVEGVLEEQVADDVEALSAAQAEPFSDDEPFTDGVPAAAAASRMATELSPSSSSVRPVTHGRDVGNGGSKAEPHPGDLRRRSYQTRTRGSRRWGDVDGGGGGGGAREGSDRWRRRRRMQPARRSDFPLDDDAEVKVRDAAWILGVSEHQLRRMANEDLIPVKYRNQQGHRVFDVEQLFLHRAAMGAAMGEHGGGGAQRPGDRRSARARRQSLRRFAMAQATGSNRPRRTRGASRRTAAAGVRGAGAQRGDDNDAEARRQAQDRSALEEGVRVAEVFSLAKKGCSPADIVVATALMPEQVVKYVAAYQAMQRWESPNESATRMVNIALSRRGLPVLEAFDRPEAWVEVIRNLLLWGDEHRHTSRRHLEELEHLREITAGPETDVRLSEMVGSPEGEDDDHNE
ncbi:MAG: hypothetical protein AAGN82_17030 [Myxococcota bacterium]